MSNMPLRRILDALSLSSILALFATPAALFAQTQTATPVLTASSTTCPTQITMTDATSGATIYYTTDGSTPTTHSTVYKLPITVNTSTVNAIAVASGFTPSAVATAAGAPTFFPLPGSYNVEPSPNPENPSGNGTVDLSTTTGSATIYYTTNGTTPTTSSPSVASGQPIPVAPAPGATMTVQAMAVADGLSSCISEGLYTYTPPSSSAEIATVGVTIPASTATIPGNFAGISLDHNEAAKEWGQSSTGIITAYRQLITNLIPNASNPLMPVPGGPFFLRIEGDGAMAPSDSTASTGTPLTQAMNAPYQIASGPYFNNCTNTSSPPSQLPAGKAEDYPQTHVTGDPLPYSLQEPLAEFLAGMPNVNVTLGIDLACDQSDWVMPETQNYYNPSYWSQVIAFEIGNEPDNYAGQQFRPASYGFSSYLNTDWRGWSSAVSNTLQALGGGTAKFMGPSTAQGDYNPNGGSGFGNGVVDNLGNGFNASIVSQHNYPMHNQPVCTQAQITAGNTSSCNIPDLLLQASSVQASNVGPKLYYPYMNAVHANTSPVDGANSMKCNYPPSTGYNPKAMFRMAEFNDTPGGGTPGISDTFQSALWLLDIEFEYACLGYDGTNLHTGNFTAYNLWGFNGVFNLQFVKPKYYGLLAFQMATANNARLLSTTFTGINNTNGSAWSTQDASGNVHIVIINKDEKQTGTVKVTVPSSYAGYSTSGILLTAPSYASSCQAAANGCMSGVTIGAGTTNGGTFDNSTTGNIVSASCPLTVSGTQICSQTPTITQNSKGQFQFSVTLPITSAILVTLKPPQ